ncbi:hypothetical protein K0A97_00980 [Patescibacteria group bacterium]|nr:hypothetical protein [Patescibacteria group bacterium]
MATQNKNKSNEDSQNKEGQREIAKKNFSNPELSNLALAYFVHQDRNGYGENCDSAVEQYKYLPSFGGANYVAPNGREYGIVVSALLESRSSGSRYSGHVSESGIIEKAASIWNDSLIALNVEDVASYLGIGLEEIPENFRSKSIKELATSDNEAMKKLGQNLLGGFLNGYFVPKGVSEALNMTAEESKKGLEGILKNGLPKKE